VTPATRIGAVSLVAGLLLVPDLQTPGSAGAAEPAVEAGTGTTAMPDQVLRHGCHTYAYTYDLQPGTDDWLLETFLLDPHRERVAAGVYSSDTEPKSGPAVFSLCRNITRFGTFKIRGKLTSYSGYDSSATWITPTFVRLHRWGK
jgi:hypothetical protein